MQVKVTEIAVTSQCSAGRQLSPPLFVPLLHANKKTNLNRQVTVTETYPITSNFIRGIERGRKIQVNVVKIWEIEQN